MMGDGVCVLGSMEQMKCDVMPLSISVGLVLQIAPFVSVFRFKPDLNTTPTTVPPETVKKLEMLALSALVN